MGDDIDLRRAALILWRRRQTVIVVTVAAIVASGAFSLLVPPVYEARAMVLVTKPSFQVGTPPDARIPGLKIGGVLGWELATETVVAFARSPMITRKVADKVAEGAVRDNRLVRKLMVQSIRNTDLVELRFRGTDPNRVALIVNEWASIVMVESEALVATGAQQSYAFFDSRLKEARTSLDSSEEALRRFNASSRIGVLQTRITAVTNQIAAYQSRLTDLAVVLQRSEAELVQAEAQIRRQSKTLTLSRSITTDPFLHQAAREATRREFLELSTLILKDEELNPIYMNLDQVRSTLAIQVAALRTEQAKVLQSIGQMNDELAGLRTQTAEQQFLQTRFLRSVENSKQVYDVVIQRREEARVATAGQAGLAKVAAEAVPPDQPVAPRKGLNMLLGGLLGLVSGTLLAFGSEYLGHRAPGPALPSDMRAASARTIGKEFEAR